MSDLSRQPESGQVLIYQDGATQLRVRLDGQTIWLTQRQLAELYQIRVPTVNEHLADIYDSGELAGEGTIRKYLIVQTEGPRQVRREVEHYSLDVVIAIGYRVRSPRGLQFRQWATAQLRDLLTKGFVLDDERIKAGRTIGHEYFDELLERIREIRASERLFYQKITDIFSRCSIDYQKDSPVARDFFATAQNKLHWAICGKTAAEIIATRAGAQKPNMGLTTWRNAPDGPIRKTDVTVAKNYLTREEISELNRIVTMYLDYAEDQARRKQPMTMAQWAARLDAFLQFNERNILTHAGTISHLLAEEHAHQEFGKFEQERLRLEAQRPSSDFDHQVEDLRKRLEEDGEGKHE